MSQAATIRAFCLLLPWGAGASCGDSATYALPLPGLEVGDRVGLVRRTSNGPAVATAQVSSGGLRVEVGPPGSHFAVIPLMDPALRPVPQSGAHLALLAGPPGRCRWDSRGGPLSVGPGDRCRVPPYVAASAWTVQEDGLQPASAATTDALLSEVSIGRPGAPGCVPTEGPQSQAELCLPEDLAAPRIQPLAVAQWSDGTVFAFNDSRWWQASGLGQAGSLRTFSPRLRLGDVLTLEDRLLLILRMPSRMGLNRARAMWFDPESGEQTPAFEAPFRFRLALSLSPREGVLLGRDESLAGDFEGLAWRLRLPEAGQDLQAVRVSFGPSCSLARSFESNLRLGVALTEGDFLAVTQGGYLVLASGTDPETLHCWSPGTPETLPWFDAQGRFVPAPLPLRIASVGRRVFMFFLDSRNQPRTLAMDVPPLEGPEVARAELSIQPIEVETEPEGGLDWLAAWPDPALTSAPIGPRPRALLVSSTGALWAVAQNGRTTKAGELGSVLAEAPTEALHAAVREGHGGLRLMTESGRILRTEAGSSVLRPTEPDAALGTGIRLLVPHGPGWLGVPEPGALPRVIHSNCPVSVSTASDHEWLSGPNWQAAAPTSEGGLWLVSDQELVRTDPGLEVVHRYDLSLSRDRSVREVVVAGPRRLMLRVGRSGRRQEAWEVVFQGSRAVLQSAPVPPFPDAFNNLQLNVIDLDAGEGTVWAVAQLEPAEFATSQTRPVILRWLVSEEESAPFHPAEDLHGPRPPDDVLPTGKRVRFAERPPQLQAVTVRCADEVRIFSQEEYLPPGIDVLHAGFGLFSSSEGPVFEILPPFDPDLSDFEAIEALPDRFATALGAFGPHLNWTAYRTSGAHTELVPNQGPVSVVPFEAEHWAPSESGLLLLGSAGRIALLRFVQDEP